MISMRIEKVITCVALAAALVGCGMVKPPKTMDKATALPPEIIIDVDFYDHVIWSPRGLGVEYFGPKEIDDIFKNCKASGVSVVYWRAYCQIANYPSKLTYNIADMEVIRSSPDDRRSEGAFSARVGVKTTVSGGGIVQDVNAAGKGKYVFSCDLSADAPGAFPAIINPIDRKIILSGQPVISGKSFQKSELRFEHDGPFAAAVLSKGSANISVFIADNLSLKDSAGKELLENGGMEIPDMLQPVAWKPFNAAFLVLNGDYRAAGPEIKKKYLPNAKASFDQSDRPYERKLFRKTMASCDTLAEAVKSARKYGIRIYAWTDPIDDGRMTLPPSSAWASRFLEEHPEYRLVNKQGRTRWGMLCFGYPEVRRYKTEVVKELLSYGVDGVALKMSYQHNKVWDGNDYDYKDFLYNDIALEEYRRIKGEPADGKYDTLLLRMIYGEFFIQWLRELRPVMEASGKRLCLFQEPSKYLDQGASAWKIDPVKIVNEKLIDDLLLEPRWNEPYKDHFAMLDAVNGYSEACRRNGIKLGYDFWLNSLFNNANTNVVDKDKGPYMKAQLLAIAEEPVDFVGIYECIHLDGPRKLWPYVKEFSEALKSPAFKRKNVGAGMPFADAMKGKKNIAAYENGAKAYVAFLDGRKKDALDLIDGDISDSSAYMAEETPFDVEIKFPAPVMVDALRIYTGVVGYSGTPSGESGMASFAAEGFADGKWFPLFKPVADISRINPAEKNRAKNMVCYNLLYRFQPVALEKVRIRVTGTTDTGRRIRSPDKPIVAEKNRATFIRELEIFKAEQ
ncbi:MAG: hypothetical protein NT011_12705 [Kiritimatiellaeota bacterium]|nr:hypothetical protein [Kiritimatiellota bacterium]